jgi:hypothetical protein
MPPDEIATEFDQLSLTPFLQLIDHDVEVVSSADDDLGRWDIAAREMENDRDRVDCDLEKSHACIRQFVREVGTNRTRFFGLTSTITQILSVDRMCSDCLLIRDRRDGEQENALGAPGCSWRSDEQQPSY